MTSLTFDGLIKEKKKEIFHTVRRRETRYKTKNQTTPDDNKLTNINEVLLYDGVVFYVDAFSK